MIEKVINVTHCKCAPVLGYKLARTEEIVWTIVVNDIRELIDQIEKLIKASQ